MVSLSSNNLDKFVGATGHVTDLTFKELTETLEEIKATTIRVMENTGLVTTHYLVGNTIYELWYQVRTPNKPLGLDYAFGFDLVTA